MRGAKPKPKVIRELEGNPSKRPIPDVPDPDPSLPDKPDWLSALASHEWDRIVPELYKLGLITKIDETTLAGYCQAWARYVEAEKLLTDQGITIVDDKGNQKTHPAVTVSQRNLEKVLKYVAEFGLSPSARMRIHIKPEEPEDEWEELLKQHAV